MKAIVYTLLFFILSGCMNIHKTSEFSFYDSYGHAYNISTAADNIKKEYNINEKPTIVLIATSSKDLKQFKEQMKIIFDVDAEKMGYMYVVADSNEVDRSGYYTDQSTASQILSGDQFKIIIYNKNGNPIILSNKILNKNELEHHLTTAFTGTTNR